MTNVSTMLTIGMISLGIAASSGVQEHIGEVESVASAVSVTQQHDINIILSTITEADVFQMNVTPGNHTLPLKAVKDTVNGIDYFLLTDGQGSFYISYDTVLKDGGNYIGTITNGKVTALEPSDFVFTYEDYFTDPDFNTYDIEIGRYMVLNK